MQLQMFGPASHRHLELGETSETGTGHIHIPSFIFVIFGHVDCN